MFFLPLFVVWLVFCGLVAAYAVKKGRSGAVFFLLSLIASPLIGFFVAFSSKDNLEALAQRSGLKKCPNCAEYVQPEAVVCRYCGNRMPVEQGGIVIDEGMF